MEEHGLGQTSANVDGQLTIGGGGQSFAGSFAIRGGQIITSGLKTFDGSPLKMAYTGPHPVLIDVTDARYETVFPVPTAHLGQPIEDRSPFNIGRLGLAHYASILDQAEALAE